MCLAQGPQSSDAGEARTSGPSVLSQALYHWATALPWKSHAAAHLFLKMFEKRMDSLHYLFTLLLFPIKIEVKEGQ